MLYTVFPYSAEALIECLSEWARAEPSSIRDKLHFIFFSDYLDKIGAKTVIVENDYVDRDYLVDYSAYYARCFKDYGKRCRRIHFFSAEVSNSAFTHYLEHGDSEITSGLLQSHYLGFIVAKPLPQTIIGRTCLVPYPSDGRRYYSVLRIYDVNLFGTKLTVESLAFQEQDSAVAACATEALWSAFHATSVRFTHKLPTPYEITKMATDLSALETRQFPSCGLTLEQMARAIRHVGLDPYIVNARPSRLLRTTAYAYLTAGIPVIMMLTLFDREDGNQILGWHAITLVGYSLATTSHEEGDLRTFADRIDRFYAHDDQVGPFARVHIENTPIQLRTEEIEGAELRLSWRNSTSGAIGTVGGVPDALIAPVYHKIRIPYEVVEDMIRTFTLKIGKITEESDLDIPQPEWDIHLTNTTYFKSEICENERVQGARRREVLTTSLPRFLWQASAYQHEKRAFDLIYDATDLGQGEMLVDFLVYGESELVDTLISAACDVELSRYMFKEPWEILLRERLQRLCSD